MSRQEKAQRLVSQSRVRVLSLTDEAVIADVRGDHDTYRVNIIFGTDDTTCTCPSTVQDCSHVLAALIGSLRVTGARRGLRVVEGGSS